MGPELSDYATVVVATDNKDVSSKREWWKPTPLSDDQTGHLALVLISPFVGGLVYMLFRTFGVGWLLVPIIVFLLVNNIGRWIRVRLLLDEKRILRRRLTRIRDSV